MSEPTLRELKENIGRACYVLESCPDWNERNGDRNVVINDVAYFRDKLAYIVSNAGVNWYVRLKHIQFEPLTPAKPLYTSSCPKCSSPARKIASGLFCSQPKCSVAKKMKSKLKLNIPPTIEAGQTLDYPIVVRCNCGKIAKNLFSSHILTNGNGAIECLTCDIVPYTFEKGKWYRFNHSNKAYYFDGFGWKRTI